ncbi:MAG TPA: amylo-alpha-1,6-glucosidase [Candidatus Limnocylindrales bacterium]|nr:amylo-alpha-1,6-glucosidase [Candidatus Limnocylindrales bacterium]
MAVSRLDSGDPAVDAAYDKANRDVAANIVGGTFIAGQDWPTLWVRDASYAIDLACGSSYPEVSRDTMRAMVSPEGVWAQDRAAHFGGWPNLTDSIVGAVGIWATFLATGDEELLRWGFGVTRNSLSVAEREIFDGALFRGCASFMESNSAYPPMYFFNGKAVGKTKALSTNMLYYRAYDLMGRMAELLGEDAQPFRAKAERLKQAINERLWMPDRGHYSYYEDAGRGLSPRMEGLGEALAVLWGVADEVRADSVLRRTPTTGTGLPCLWPRHPTWRLYLRRAEYYHNGMVWPFVQGYWAWAAASRLDVSRLDGELAKLTALAGHAGTFHEFYRPEGGRPDGSPRQLWSAAGYLATVHHGLFGIDADVEEIRFRPVVPARFSSLTLHDFSHRGMTLSLSTSGSGTQIASIKLDGAEHPRHSVPSTLTGRHTVAITLR